MSLLTCCFWWFVLGLLLGWLLNWLLSKMLRKDPPTISRVERDGAGFAATPTPAPYTPAAPTAPVSTVREAASTPASRIVDVGAARISGFNLKNADDLTIIEGIGPKIDELFRANGVTGFAQVARLSVAEMLAILEKGGPNFRLANPGSWAQQALLASENRWSELKQLQDELVGGVDPAGDH